MDLIRLFSITRGRKPATPFQQTFFRAGHAHAGVLGPALRKEPRSRKVDKCSTVFI